MWKLSTATAVPAPIFRPTTTNPPADQNVYRRNVTAGVERGIECIVAAQKDKLQPRNQSMDGQTLCILSIQTHKRRQMRVQT